MVSLQQVDPTTNPSVLREHECERPVDGGVVGVVEGPHADVDTRVALVRERTARVSDLK